MNKELQLQRIFRVAAELYDDASNPASTSGCCMAIGNIERKGDPMYATLPASSYRSGTIAQEFFSALYDNGGIFYWGHPRFEGYEEDREARVLALLFAAEAARTGL